MMDSVLKRALQAGFMNCDSFNFVGDGILASKGEVSSLLKEVCETVDLEEFEEFIAMSESMGIAIMDDIIQFINDRKTNLKEYKEDYND